MNRTDIFAALGLPARHSNVEHLPVDGGQDGETTPVISRLSCSAAEAVRLSQAGEFAALQAKYEALQATNAGLVEQVQVAEAAATRFYQLLGNSVRFITSAGPQLARWMAENLDYTGPTTDFQGVQYVGATATVVVNPSDSSITLLSENGQVEPKTYVADGGQFTEEQQENFMGRARRIAIQAATENDPIAAVATIGGTAVPAVAAA